VPRPRHECDKPCRGGRFGQSTKYKIQSTSSARVAPELPDKGASDQMRALVKHPDEVGLRLDDVSVPEPDADQILIRVHSTGICGTDLHIFNWDEWARETIPAPMTIGHEFSGHIVSLGSNVSGFTEGELVSAEGHVVCG